MMVLEWDDNRYQVQWHRDENVKKINDSLNVIYTDTFLLWYILAKIK
jgi:hypothetical protein